MLAAYAIKAGSDEIQGERLDEKWYMGYETAFEDFCELFKKYRGGKLDVVIIILDLDSDYVMAKAEIFAE